MKISVSFLKGLTSQEETIKLIEETSCDYIHVDQMDGNFVSEYNFIPEDIIPYFNNISKPLEVHLMTINPQQYFDIYSTLNTKLIYIHYELDENISELIKQIKKLKIKAGLAINPETSINDIKPYLKDIDSVLVMSVHPGKGGQTFIPSSLVKIKELKTLKEYLNYHYTINVDGGINDLTAMQCKEAGVDIIVSGSYICMSGNYEEQINKLRK